MIGPNWIASRRTGPAAAAILDNFAKLYVGSAAFDGA
jgi:hypothetical protein